MQPGLHGRMADPQSFRRLANIQMLHVAQDEHLAVDIGQFPHGFSDGFTHFLLFHYVAWQVTPVRELSGMKRLLLESFQRVLVDGLTTSSASSRLRRTEYAIRKAPRS